MSRDAAEVEKTIRFVGIDRQLSAWFGRADRSDSR